MKAVKRGGKLAILGGFVVVGLSLLLLVLLLRSAYRYLYYSDEALLGDNYCLYIATTQVLGNERYQPSCDRSSYAEEVVTVPGPDREPKVLFRFKPLAGKETECPPLVISVDRRSGAASLVLDAGSAPGSGNGSISQLREAVEW